MDINDVLLRIGQIRSNAKLSARKLSESIGRNESYINGIESKKKIPPLENLFEIIDACNSTPAEFFYYSIADYKQDREIIELLKNATFDRKAMALQILNMK